jgi:hypothetical protein
MISELDVSAAGESNMPRLRSFCLLSMLSVLTLFYATSALAADNSSGYPTPSPYPISWELKFTHGIPKRIAVSVPNSPSPVAYWYMTFTVTNTGDKEQTFLPQFEMLTDNGHAVRSDVNIPQRVFEAIKNAEHDKYLEPISAVTGQIRLGESEARDSVAIWPETLPRMGHFPIFVTGLSGEAVILKLVNGQYQKVNQAQDMKDLKNLVILRKTLQLNFFIRGDEVYPGEDEVNQKDEEWIMR